MRLSDDTIYLLYCMEQIKGKIDWDIISKQLGLVSSNAASQRLVRMKKQFRDEIAADSTYLSGGAVATSPNYSPTKSTSGSNILSPVKKGNRVVKRGGKAKGMNGRGKKQAMKKRENFESEVDEDIEFTSDE